MRSKRLFTSVFWTPFNDGLSRGSSSKEGNRSKGGNRFESHLQGSSFRIHDSLTVKAEGKEGLYECSKNFYSLDAKMDGVNKDHN